MVFTQLSMVGQKALRFHQEYLNLCSKEDEKVFQVCNDMEQLMTGFSFLSELSL